MKILTRYILFLYIRVMGLCIGAFCAIYLIIDFLEKIGNFSKAHAHMQNVILYFVYKIPEILIQVMPLGVLLSTLLTLGILSRNNEVTAMRSSGMSLRFVTTPILCAAFASSLLSLVLNEFVFPVTYQKMRYIEQVEINKKDYATFFRRDNIWYRQNNLIMRARLFEPASDTFKGITIWEDDDRMQPLRRIDAAAGKRSGKIWTLSDVTVREFNNGEVAKTSSEKSRPAALGLKEDDLKIVSKYAEDMGFRELRRYCNNLRKSGYDPRRYLADMHAKISYPFASFIMAFLGIPFALAGSRSSGTALGIAQSLGIGFSYFIVNAVVLSFGHNGVLPPLVSAWAANVIFALSGIWLAMRFER